ncbi:hypothetical protein [Sphingomonas lenta]|uniref:Uncharacterized protein n=1 Tax=Sphingomonas lenta TaxID=1141887 RepID=A0A2A2SAY5_9SPHN|nr:hypothetical protein [Sphingomonas lenta]PAX06418.1 hypothetical protein CKY28_17655 [Sphingomonas lenta]
MSVDLRRASVALCAAAMPLAGCETFQPTNGAAVQYNRSFARARDEVTVLNVLRASGRQPLQFSTVSTVTGEVRTGVQVTLPFTNVIAGGDDEISPSFGFTNRNPAVTIVPLASKEFVQGLSRPIDPVTVDELIAQGWSREVVLRLVVAGVVCPAGETKLNDGTAPALDRQFIDMAAKSTTFTLSARKVKSSDFLLPEKEALTVLKDGVGSDAKVRLVSPGELPGRAGKVRLRVTPVADTTISGLGIASVCGTLAVKSPAGADGSAGQGDSDQDHAGGGVRVEGGGSVFFRSVLGIYNYLGRLHARRTASPHDCRGDTSLDARGGLFVVRQACPGAEVPAHTLVSTEFQGRRWFVPGSATPGADETSETLAVLTVLTDMQTTESTLRSSAPVVAVTE